MALVTALFSCPRCNVAARIDQAETRPVAKDFSYPEAPETVTNEVPYEAKSLAGRVADVTGAGLDKVLVERLGSGWGGTPRRDVHGLGRLFLYVTCV